MDTLEYCKKLILLYRRKDELLQEIKDEDHGSEFENLYMTRAKMDLEYIESLISEMNNYPPLESPFGLPV